MADRDRQLDQAEDDVAAAVAEALTATADEFADAVAAATELVAARFSVGRIARMWGNRVSGLVRRLLGVAETAAEAAAEDLDTDLPDGWDDLPGRYDDDRALPDGIGQYVETTEHLLRAVGDRLAEAARRELAEGIDAGEDIGQLRARLREAFNREGANLGPGREDRIARTEASRAWNTATLAAARAVTGPDQPVVKQWITRHDARVRTAHDQVDGQLRLLAEPFTVAGVSMDAPGDPTAPPELVINCRCRLGLAPERHASAYEPKDPARVGVLESEESSVETEESVTADGGYTGAMIALVPSPEDAARLALATPGAEPAHELHLTLYYLGAGADWSPESQAALVAQLRNQIDDGPVYGRVFGANHWNADRDAPCWVWAIGDDPDRPEDAPRLEDARRAAGYALEELPGLPTVPVQHSPWQPHVCAAYSDSADPLTAMNDRLGPIRFDRLRVSFAGQRTDIPLGPQEGPADRESEGYSREGMAARAWFTPEGTGLVFENSETGDGRVFSPGALYWDGPGPWPLQYAEEMLVGHQGAELVGPIQTVTRHGARIASTGLLYTCLRAGADVLMLLEQGAPLGVSVDLDDVTVEFVDRTITDDDMREDVMLMASLTSASMLRLEDGSWMVTGMSTADWTASGIALSRTATGVQLITGPDGQVPAAAVQAAFAGTQVLTAAAGDPDDPDLGVIVHRESSGDLLMRVTRARLRGATLVAMPAYDKARIVLAPRSEDPRPEGDEDELWAGAGLSEAHMQVVAYVKTSPMAVGAREVAQALGMKMEAVRGHLARAAKAGRIVRLARGLYIGPTEEGSGDITAAVSGDVNLPIHDDREARWDGGGARSRLLKWATGDDGNVDGAKLGRGFLYRDDEADPETVGAYKLPFADVFDGEPHMVASGVFAVAAALQGAQGGVDLPPDDRDKIGNRVEKLYARLAKFFKDDSIRPPWSDEDQAASLGELEASAWTAMRDADPMPAAWFREPTAEELPPGSGGVHYVAGRVYGWVAQAGEPHAGMPGRVTIESLGRIDLSHFLRARFALDDGSMVRAGAFTMNVGHHRDGAECETAACQYDDTRTVAAIVTVGMNAGGMWFSGAAAPWLADWDRKVFAGCQPSYHMKKGPGGQWQLRAVLSVPMPAHSSPLVAAAVCERSNLALAASAGTTALLPDTDPDVSGQPADDRPDIPALTADDLCGQRPDTDPDNTPDKSGQLSAMITEAEAEAVAALLSSVPFLDVLLAALDRRQEQQEAARAEVDQLAAAVTTPAAATSRTTTTTEGEA